MHAFRLTAAFASLLALVALASCSKSGGSSYGGPTGPGIGSGPSFNFTFPATGSSSTFTFADSGTWAYHCTPHQSVGMTGSVVVTASGADSDTVAVGVGAGGANAFAFKPATVTIKPGGHVRWINRSTMVNHTVTRP